MKRYKLIAMGILVIAVLVISPLASRQKVYEKTMKYSDPIDAIEDCIGYGNVRVRSDDDSSYTPKEFFESISRRLRLSAGDDNLAVFHFPQIPPTFAQYKIEEVKGKELEALKREHLQSYSTIPNYKKPDNIHGYRLTGIYSKGYPSEDISKIREDGSTTINDNEFEEKFNRGGFYFVVVDEGEGYVVDYYRELHDKYGDYSLSSEVN